MADKKNVTLRLDPDLHAALRLLAETTASTLNGMIVEAVEAYVSVRSREVERDLESTLERLRATRQRDPDHLEAIRSFAAAEGKHEDPIDGQASADVRSEMHELLGSS